MTLFQSRGVFFCVPESLTDCTMHALRWAGLIDFGVPLTRKHYYRREGCSAHAHTCGPRVPSSAFDLGNPSATCDVRRNEDVVYITSGWVS